MNPAEATALILLFALLLAGCQEPAYRTQVKGNGQGGIEIQRVPNDEPPLRPAATAPAQRRFDALEIELRQQRAQIETLQAQIEKQNQEIRRLKQAPTTATTAP